MKKFACRYAIVRFLPYPETQEFANVGIVLACPETGYFGFKVEKHRRYGRVSGFFKRLDMAVFGAAMAGFEKELARIAALVAEERMRGDGLRAAFEALVHPREAIVRFGSPRALLTEEPEQAVGDLFAYYVEHDFATPDHHERVMMKRVRALLNGLRLDRPFREMDIGDPNYAHAKFPLVQRDEERVLKAIKPFFLAQDEANKILTHGGAWVDRIMRLRKRQLLPGAVLFAVEGPAPTEGARFEAYDEICRDLRGYDVEVVPAGQERQIASFATA
jgi:hypothetical protein